MDNLNMLKIGTQLDVMHIIQNIVMIEAGR